MTELRSKLATELLPSEWKMLAMHYRRDALFIVDASVTLLDAAVAVAEDDRERVSRWIDEGQIARPTPEQARAWEAEEGPRFLSVIVQPFVLAQRLDDVAGESPPV